VRFDEIGSPCDKDDEIWRHPNDKISCGRAMFHIYLTLEETPLRADSISQLAFVIARSDGNAWKSVFSGCNSRLKLNV
jgi:hypothetical protein